MAYTNKALAAVWLCALTLFALSGTGIVDGRGMLILALVAFVMPAAVLTIFPRPTLLLASVAATASKVLTPPRVLPMPKTLGSVMAGADAEPGRAVSVGIPDVRVAVVPLAPSAAVPTAFRLRAIVRQGTAASVPAIWERYASLDEARAVVRSVYASDRVLRVSIVTSDVPPRFVEWVER